MSEKTVAILGATGVVGQQMLQCLEERRFPVGKLVPLASQRSVDAGKTVRFAGEDVPVRLAEPDAFEGVDIVPRRGRRRHGPAPLLPEAVPPRCRVRGQLPRLPHGPPTCRSSCRRSTPPTSRPNHGIIANPQLRHDHRPRARVAAPPARGRDAPRRLHLPGRLGRWQARPRRARARDRLRGGRKAPWGETAPLPVPARREPHPADRRLQGRGLHLRGAQDAQRGPQDHAPPRAARELHLRPRAGGALALRVHHGRVRAAPLRGGGERRARGRAGRARGGRAGRESLPPCRSRPPDQDLVYVGRIRRDPLRAGGASPRSPSGAAATRSARARRPTPCRSRSTWSSRRGGARRTGGPGVGGPSRPRRAPRPPRFRPRRPNPLRLGGIFDAPSGSGEPGGPL